MSWIKLDDGFHEHPKILAVGPIGEALFVNALGYCARNLTDGFVPRPIYRALVSRFEGVEVERVDATALDWAAKLVAVGLWEVDTERGGWRIHDYLDFNPSREQVEADREEWRRSRAVGGKARAAQAVRGPGGRFESSKSSMGPSVDAGSVLAVLDQHDQHPTSPVPVPVPVPGPLPEEDHRGEEPEERGTDRGAHVRPEETGTETLGTGAPIDSSLGEVFGPGGSPASMEGTGDAQPPFVAIEERPGNLGNRIPEDSIAKTERLKKEQRAKILAAQGISR